MKVRIGYGLGTAGGHDLGGLVDSLERFGFDSLWLSEQLTGGAVDPLIGLAFAAGRTTKLKLGMSVLVVPGKNPVALAKQLATPDVLSNGRLLPAVGLGAPNNMEHGAFGADRGAGPADPADHVPAAGHRADRHHPGGFPGTTGAAGGLRRRRVLQVRAGPGRTAAVVGRRAGRGGPCPARPPEPRRVCSIDRH